MISQLDPNYIPVPISPHFSAPSCPSFHLMLAPWTQSWGWGLTLSAGLSMWWCSSMASRAGSWWPQNSSQKGICWCGKGPFWRFSQRHPWSARWFWTWKAVKSQWPTVRCHQKGRKLSTPPLFAGVYFCQLHFFFKPKDTSWKANLVRQLGLQLPLSRALLLGCLAESQPLRGGSKPGSTAASTEGRGGRGCASRVGGTGHGWRAGGNDGRLAADLDLQLIEILGLVDDLLPFFVLFVTVCRFVLLIWFGSVLVSHWARKWW